MRSDKVTPNKIRDMVRDRLLLQLRSRGKSIYLQSTGISTDAGWIAQVEVTVSSFHFFFLVVDRCHDGCNGVRQWKTTVSSESLLACVASVVLNFSIPISRVWVLEDRACHWSNQNKFGG